MVKRNADGTRSVKIKASIVDKVERDKNKTGVSIGKFFEIAAEEKLKKQKSKV